MDWKVSMVFNRNCFPKMTDISRLGALQAVTYTLIVVLSKQWREIDTTNRKYHMAYLFVPFPMTVDDLEGHSPNAGLIKCNSTNVCATFSTVLTITARRAVPRRQLSFSLTRAIIARISRQALLSTSLCSVMPNSHRPPNTTPQCCLCRVGRCELSLETVWQSLNSQPIDHPRRVAFSEEV